MAQPFSITLPPNLQLWGGCQIIIHAVDPTDGGQVTGVQMQNATFEVSSDDVSDLAYGPFVLVTGPEG